MCPSCASRNPGFFGPAMVFLLGKRQLEDIFWIPAFAGMTCWVKLAMREASCFIRLPCYR